MPVNIKLSDTTINKVKPLVSKRRFNKKKIWTITLVVIVVIGALFFGCNHFLQKTGLNISLGDILNPIKSDPQLKKDSSGRYTNALLVGIDTRAENPGLQNTDSIMFLSYDHKDNQAIFISIPRDFFVEVPEQGRYTKINGIYAIGERSEPGSGLELLQGVVEEIINKEIQYYMMVNLTGFVDLVDALDGLEVDVENSFTDYQYPLEDSEHLFQTVSFKEGLQTMDGLTALRFVRSRHSNDNHEGSDFTRARRQQRIIMAIREKAFSSKTILNPIKFFEILNIIDKNIDYSEFSNEEVQALIKIFKKENLKTHSFVLDPSIANFELITDKGLTLDAYTIGPIAGLNKYDDLHKYIEYIYEKPLIYSEDPTILVYDVGLGYQEAAEKVEEYQENLPYIDIRFMGTLFNDQTNKYLYKTEEEFSNLDPFIEKYFSIKIGEKPDNRIFNGDYIILLGSDY